MSRPANRNGDNWGTLVFSTLRVTASFVYWSIWVIDPGSAWAAYAPWVSPVVLLATLITTNDAVRPFIRRVLAPHQTRRPVGSGSTPARTAPPTGLLPWMDQRREGLRNLCVGIMVSSGFVAVLGTGLVYGYVPLASRGAWMWLVYLFEWFGLMVTPLVYYLVIDNEVIVERPERG